MIVPEFLSAIHDYEHTEKQILSFINRFEGKVGTEVVKMHRAHWKQIIFAKLITINPLKFDKIAYCQLLSYESNSMEGKYYLHLTYI